MVPASDGERIFFGVMLRGVGSAWFDDLHLEFEEEDGSWVEIPISNPDFEASATDLSGWRRNGIGHDLYTTEISTDRPAEGAQSLRVTADESLLKQGFSLVGWSPDGESVVALDHSRSALVYVPAAGGAPRVVMSFEGGRRRAAELSVPMAALSWVSSPRANLTSGWSRTSI